MPVNPASLGYKMTHMSPAATIATSIILKDAVGCYLYVTQARKNKKMTPQQRADVANYDLANGIINIGLQLLAIRPIENLMTKFTEKKIIPHYFKNLETKLKNSDNKSVMDLLKKKQNLTKGTVAIFSVLICQYFIKRVVSPFFSVPAGEKTKQLGIIKPKLYEGEEMPDKNKKDPTLDIISKPENQTTNLLKLYKQQHDIYDAQHSDGLRAIKNFPC